MVPISRCLNSLTPGKEFLKGFLAIILKRLNISKIWKNAKINLKMYNNLFTPEISGIFVSLYL